MIFEKIVALKEGIWSNYKQIYILKIIQIVLDENNLSWMKIKIILKYLHIFFFLIWWIFYIQSNSDLLLNKFLLREKEFTYYTSILGFY